MAKQTFPMHLYAKEVMVFAGEDINREVRFRLSEFTDADYLGSYVGAVSVEAEVPDTFDLRAAQLREKQAELQKVRSEFTKRITDLQAEISRLSALEMA